MSRIVRLPRSATRQEKGRLVNQRLLASESWMSSLANSSNNSPIKPLTSAPSGIVAVQRPEMDQFARQGQESNIREDASMGRDDDHSATLRRVTAAKWTQQKGQLAY